MRRGTFLGTSLAAAAATAVPSRAFARTEPGSVWVPRSTTIPISIVDNEIFVSVSVGKHEYAMLFDTATSGGMLSAQAGATLNGFPVGQAHVGKNQVETDVVVVKNFRVGGAVQSDAQFAIAPKGVGLQNPKTGWSLPYGGVFGLGFYKHLIAIVAYKDRTLTFVDPQLFHPHPNDVELDLTLRQGAVPNTTFTINGVHGNFDIETGSKKGLVMYPTFVAHAGLNGKLSPPPPVYAGNVEVAHPVVSVAPAPTGFMSEAKVAGSAGGAFLRNFVMTLDVDAGKAYFRLGT